MVFQRVWDSSCPHVWDSWKSSDGEKWVIRDLRPEDDEEAIKILVENQCPDASLCRLSDILNDLISLESLKNTWRNALSQRMSLGCYKEDATSSKLVALNVCFVRRCGDDKNDKGEGKAFQKYMRAVKFCREKVDIFKILNVDMYLHASGLVVRRDYRGARLGVRILAAREPLCLHYDIKGTCSVFTSPQSQRIAEDAGFTTVVTVTIKELVDAGIDFPKDETKCIKLMIKKFLEPLCLHNDIKRTSTVFTSPQTQRIAAHAGFTTAATVTIKELVDAGIEFSKSDTKCIKLMVKKFL